MLHAEPPDDLAGFHAPLLPGSAVKLSVAGAVEDTPAEVVFDLASPMTTVTAACFEEPQESHRVVRFPTPSGQWAELREISLRSARVGSLRLGTRPAAVWVGPRSCELTLGMDVLAPYALEVDPLERTMRISRSKERGEYASQVEAKGAADEVHLLELSRHPATDWPLVTLRLRQPGVDLVGPFIVSTREPHSVVSDAAAHQAGLKPGADLLKDLDLPAGASVPPPLMAPGYPVEGMELAPGFSLKWDAVVADTKWNNAGAVGMIGSDVWGRFYATFDVHAGVLVLRRPRVFASGDRQRCALGASPTEESCFQLRTSHAEGKPLEVVGIVWRDLPEGARVYLEPLGADGAPLQLACRVGLTFDRAERGASTEHVLPWDGLQKALPDCAAELHRVNAFALGLFEEGALAECPGECAFVQELLTQRVTCECAPQLWGGGTESEARFLKLYRQLLERVRKSGAKPPAEEPEPED
jgi:hypothetical protein